MTKSISEQFAADLTEKSARRLAEQQLEGTRNQYATSTVYGTTAGKKFDRITILGPNGQARSVHAFVDKATGDLIKAAGWAAPAKDKNGHLMARYNLSTIAGYRHALFNADDFGSYLYADFPQVNPPADAHGNHVAREGYDRCICGAKYWENDTCTSCGTHVTKAVNVIEED